jgi:hypothetical protein
MEKREQELRRKEFQREDLVKQLNQDNVFRSNLGSDERVENTRRLKGQQARQEEFRMQQSLIEVNCQVYRFCGCAKLSLT